jgi:hypothetical protein
MKAILINPENQTITKMEIDKGLEAIYKVMGCSIFACPVSYPNGDTLYCDDEGLYKPDIKGAFTYPNWHSPIVGKCLIMGTNEIGESTDCESIILDIEKNIEWITEGVAKKYAEYFN